MSLGRVSLFRCGCVVAGLLAGFWLAPRLQAQTSAHAVQGAQAVIGTPQEANERIKEMSAVASRSNSHDYIIGNGDLIDFEVFDVKELSREVRVSQSGTIGIPLVPVRIHVSGLTENTGRAENRRGTGSQWSGFQSRRYCQRKRSQKQTDYDCRCRCPSHGLSGGSPSGLCWKCLRRRAALPTMRATA